MKPQLRTPVLGVELGIHAWLEKHNRRKLLATRWPLGRSKNFAKWYNQLNQGRLLMRMFFANLRSKCRR